MVEAPYTGPWEYRHGGNDCRNGRSSRNPKGFAVGTMGSATEGSMRNSKSFEA